MAHGGYRSFEEFYPFYLSEHSRAAPGARTLLERSVPLHAGPCVWPRSGGASSRWCLCGHGLAWVGHSRWKGTGRRPSSTRCTASR
jgi:hypothetical protein